MSEWVSDDDDDGGGGWLGWVGLGGWVDCIKFSHHLLCNSYVHTNHTSHSCCFQPLCRGKLWAWSQLFIQHMPIGGPPKIIKFWQFWIWVQELSSSPLINLSGGGEWVSEWVMMMVVVVGWLGWVGWVGGMHEILTPPTLQILCSYQPNQSTICQVHLLKDWALPW